MEKKKPNLPAVYPFSIKATLDWQLPFSFILRLFYSWSPCLILPFPLHQLILGFPERSYNQETSSPQLPTFCSAASLKLFPPLVNRSQDHQEMRVPHNLGFSTSSRKRKRSQVLSVIPVALCPYWVRCLIIVPGSASFLAVTGGRLPLAPAEAHRASHPAVFPALPGLCPNGGTGQSISKSCTLSLRKRILPVRWGCRSWIPT